MTSSGMYSMRPCLTASSKSIFFTPWKMSVPLMVAWISSAASLAIWQPSGP